MKIFVLIVTLLTLISCLRPSTFTTTIKESVDNTLKKIEVKTFKQSMIISMIFVSILSICTYFLIPIKSFQIFICFTMLWSLYDFCMTDTYINKNRVMKLFDSRVYKFISHIIDISYFSFIVVYLILH